MATDMFLNVKDCPGECQDDKHANEISVLSYSFACRNSGTAAINVGTGSGRAEIDDLKVQKYIDKASPNLFLFCCNGKPIDECKLTLRRSGEKPLEYAIYTMNTCMVSSVRIIGVDKNDQIVEEVGLNFAKLKIEYHEQDPKTGGSKGAVTATWDHQKSKAG